LLTFCSIVAFASHPAPAVGGANCALLAIDINVQVLLFGLSILCLAETLPRPIDVQCLVNQPSLIICLNNREILTLISIFPSHR
jgi:hypothetical protein